MNTKQRAVLWCGIVLVVLMGLIPPWQYTFVYLRTGASQTRPAGYSLIFAPPAPEIDNAAYGVRLDVSRLLVQWALVGLGTLGIVVALRDASKTAPQMRE